MVMIMPRLSNLRARSTSNVNSLVIVGSKERKRKNATREKQQLEPSSQQSSIEGKARRSAKHVRMNLLPATFIHLELYSDK
jgi:hypothetical protein